MRLASSPLFSEGKTFDLMYANPAGEWFDPGRQFAFMRGLDGCGALVVANFDDKAVDVKVNVNRECLEYLGLEPDPAFSKTLHIGPNDVVIVKNETYEQSV